MKIVVLFTGNLTVSDKFLTSFFLVLQTTDVQTASLVIVNCVPHIPSEVCKDVRVSSWIEK